MMADKSQLGCCREEDSAVILLTLFYCEKLQVYKSRGTEEGKSSAY